MTMVLWLTTVILFASIRVQNILVKRISYFKQPILNIEMDEIPADRIANVRHAWEILPQYYKKRRIFVAVR